MKTALLLLVALAVAAGPAQALRCHVCSNSMNCKKPQTCSPGSRYCRTMSKMEPVSGNLVCGVVHAHARPAEPGQQGHSSHPVLPGGPVQRESAEQRAGPHPAHRCHPRPGPGPRPRRPDLGPQPVTPQRKGS
nr:PREDICTED: lymphocyte antigen 6D [Equus przewalskii]